MEVLISVIIATRNASSSLKEAIHSFLNQTFQEKELIVIDALSNDGTQEIVKSYGQKIAYFVSEKDHGISDAWNKGVKQAKGKWIYFLGADDYFSDKESLENVSRFLLSQPEDRLIVYGQVWMEEENGNRYLRGKPWSFIKNSITYQMQIPHQGCFHSKELFKKFTGFNLNYRIAGDYELILKSLQIGEPLFVEQVIAVCKIGGLSTNYQHRPKTLLEFRKASEEILRKPVPKLWHLQYGKALILSKLDSIIGSANMEKFRRLKQKLLTR
jgi:glycosyltransferase involved in cell wall biosynthesis